MTLTAGTRIGPYEILGAIGAGGMGEVYKARDTRLDRMVALKVAREHFTERFGREARAIAALNHPNICSLYDIGSDYLVMEYLDGERLHGPVAVNTAVRYAGQICDALATAHAQGITHRDLKPANIMITKSGLKILDFGLAKVAGAGPAEEIKTLGDSLTQSGSIVGTPAYMAPEQIEGREVDARTDIFAFGCVLYELLCGKRAFEGTSTLSLIAAVLKEEPQRLCELAPQIPASLERVIARCLAKDPDVRWQNVRDLKHAIEDAADAPAAAQASPKQKRWLTAGAAVVFITALVISAYFVRQSPSDEQTLQLRLAPPFGAEFLRAPNRGGMALSSDGRMLAFTATREGQMRLWIQLLDSSAARELPATEGAHLPFWSPDNHSLAFFAGGKLKRIDADGGRLQVLCDVRAPQGGTWNRDGVILFAPDYGPVHRIPATGGTPVVVGVVDTTRRETGHAGPQFLADGRRFLYRINSPNPEVAGVYVGSLDDTKLKQRLMQADSWVLPARAALRGADYLVWARGDTVVAQQWNASSFVLDGEPLPLGGPVGVLGNTPDLAVSQNGLLIYGSPVELQLTWFDRDGKPLGTAGDPGFLTSPRLSPDARKVAVSYDRPASGLFVVDLARGISSRLTSQGNGAFWSPDGSDIAFNATRQGVTNIMLKKADGTGSERPVATSAGNQRLAGWLSDGQSVVYYESGRNGSTQELWIAPLAGRGKPHLVATTLHREPEAQVSEDGRWLAYASDESGRLEVYVQRFQIEPSGRKQRWQVSSNGGTFPRWRRDSKELFYMAMDGELMSVAVKPGLESLEPAPPHVLFPLRAIFNASYSYDVNPDGQRFLAVAPSSRRGREPLSVIVNWPAALGK